MTKGPENYPPHDATPRQRLLFIMRTLVTAQAYAFRTIPRPFSPPNQTQLPDCLVPDRIIANARLRTYAVKERYYEYVSNDQ